MASGSSFDALNPEIWSIALQENLEKSLIALDICSTALRDELKVGDTIHKPYVSNISTVDYVPGTDFAVTGVTATDEGISASVKKIAPFYVDDVWELQANYDFAATLAADAAYQLRDQIDQLVLAYGSAIGISALGTSGADTGTFVTGTTADVSAITATSATIVDVFIAARKYLRAGNVEEAGDWIAVITQDIAGLIDRITTEKGFQIADASLRNGYAGDFLGFHIYLSNNLPTSKCIFGKRGSIDLVLQSAPKMEIKEEPKKLGRNFVAWTVYGAGILTRNKNRTINAMLTA